MGIFFCTECASVQILKSVDLKKIIQKRTEDRKSFLGLINRKPIYLSQLQVEAQKKNMGKIK